MKGWPLPDARYFQIAALGVLLVLNFTLIDFGAWPLASAVAIGGALVIQYICSRLTGLPQLDLRSPLITGLSLSLLLRADSLWIYAVAAVVAIGSKFLLRIDGKQIWNPAGLAIAVLLLTSNGVWISPGQWGADIWFATLTGFLAIMVLGAARRADISIFFFASHAVLLLARAWWLGDPWAIPIHQLQSGSVLGRFLFALAIASLAYYMTFFMQIRPALYFALIVVSPATIVIDRLMPAKRFAWADSAPQGFSP